MPTGRLARQELQNLSRIAFMWLAVGYNGAIESQAREWGPWPGSGPSMQGSNNNRAASCLRGYKPEINCNSFPMMQTILR